MVLHFFFYSVVVSRSVLGLFFFIMCLLCLDTMRGVLFENMINRWLYNPD